ncbi:MAG: hypothetical protein EOP34_11510, partial [Rickettsiales bacterium]
MNQNTIDIKEVKSSIRGREATNHWWGQRFTALMLIPLSIWFVSIIIGLFSYNQRLILTMFKSLL